jgi:hypothetical protein
MNARQAIEMTIQWYKEVDRVGAAELVGQDIAKYNSLP